MVSRRWRGGLLVLGLVLFPAGAASADQDPPPLVAAASAADAQAVGALLEAGADPDVRAADGATALLWASYRDDVESATILIGAGADVNAANEIGATPIWAASRNASPEMADVLLAAGADPDIPLRLGETPLGTASRSGSAAVVRMLLERGASVNVRAARGQTPLMFAAAQRHPDVVAVLLEYGADVNAVSDTWNQLTAQSPHSHPEHQKWILHGGNTALMFAARSGDLASARHLVTAGADVDAPSAWGLTPLALAVYGDFGDPFLVREQTTDLIVEFARDRILPGEFFALAEFLLEAGADPNAGAHRFTPLIAAILHQNEETVRLLLSHGADPNLPVGDFTPHQRGSTTDFFIHRASVGASPLWMAARFSTPGIVGVLLESGADPHFVHRGVYWGGGRGGNLSPRQEESTTTLMAALQMGTGRWWTVLRPDEESILETVGLLVDAGVDLNATGSALNAGARGVATALEAAVALELPSVADVLAGAGALTAEQIEAR